MSMKSWRLENLQKQFFEDDAVITFYVRRFRLA